MKRKILNSYQNKILKRWALYSELNEKDRNYILKKAQKCNKKVKLIGQRDQSINNSTNDSTLDYALGLLGKYNHDDLNVIFSQKGLCPLLFCGFDKDFSIISVNDFLLVIEVSTFYLYKQIKYIDNININIIDRVILKKPLNFAEKKFLLHDEYLTYLKLKDSAVAPFIPKCRYEDGVLKRTYLDGPTGHDLLKGKIHIEEGTLLSLMFFYQESIALANKNIFLDIHPGNFCLIRNKLFLFDLGPIPSIGFDYFKCDNFEQYYKKVWIDRLCNMKKYPIRSFDL